MWKIDDKERLEESLAVIHWLSGKPRHTSYHNERLRQRLPLFPPRRDFVSQLPPMVYAVSQPTPSIGFRKLADVLAAGAQECAAKGDVAGFSRIVADWRFLAEASIRGSETLIDGLVARVMIAGPLKNFRDAARKLGREEEAVYFAELDDRINQENETRKANWKAIGNGDDPALRGSVMASLMVPMTRRQVNSPPVVTEADLRPGRYADHALLERVGTWPAWGLLGICAGVAALSRFRQNPLAWRLSGRMQDVFRGSDWVWGIFGGVVFPVIWYFGITRWTPLAAREWSVQSTGFIQQCGQFGCLVLSMIILPVLVVSRRLAKRGVAFGLVGRMQWLGWLAAGAALAGVPAFGGMMLPGETGRAFQLAAYGLAGLAGTWIFAGLAVNVIGQSSQSLRRATLARLLPSVWVAGMLLLAALVPYFHAEERRWIQLDSIYAFSPDSPAPTRYEYEVSRILRGELLELIGKPETAR